MPGQMLPGKISQPSGIGQKWFCIQNLRTDFSFKEKRIFVIPFHGFFGTPCEKLPRSPRFDIEINFLTGGIILNLTSLDL